MGPQKKCRDAFRRRDFRETANYNPFPERIVSQEEDFVSCLTQSPIAREIPSFLPCVEIFPDIREWSFRWDHRRRFLKERKS